MELIKTFLKSKQAYRAYWTILNTLMALVVGLVAYLASENVSVAMVILPFAQAFAQWFTKEIVNKK
jgi:hypothetical protein